MGNTKHAFTFTIVSSIVQYYLHLESQYCSSVTLVRAEVGAGSRSLRGGTGGDANGENGEDRFLLWEGYSSPRGNHGGLVLGETCSTAMECSPGLFTMEGLWTQCEVTPFSNGESACCKSFATPCDSDEACCSGRCHEEYTRCSELFSTFSSAVHGQDSPQELTPSPSENREALARGSAAPVSTQSPISTNQRENPMPGSKNVAAETPMPLKGGGSVIPLAPSMTTTSPPTVTSTEEIISASLLTPSPTPGDEKVVKAGITPSPVSRRTPLPLSSNPTAAPKLMPNSPAISATPSRPSPVPSPTTVPTSAMVLATQPEHVEANTASPLVAKEATSEPNPKPLQATEMDTTAPSSSKTTASFSSVMTPTPTMAPTTVPTLSQTPTPTWASTSASTRAYSRVRAPASTQVTEPETAQPSVRIAPTPSPSPSPTTKVLARSSLTQEPSQTWTDQPDIAPARPESTNPSTHGTQTTSAPTRVTEPAITLAPSTATSPATSSGATVEVTPTSSPITAPTSMPKEASAKDGTPPPVPLEKSLSPLPTSSPESTDETTAAPAIGGDVNSSITPAPSMVSTSGTRCGEEIECGEGEQCCEDDNGGKGEEEGETNTEAPRAVTRSPTPVPTFKLEEAAGSNVVYSPAPSVSACTPNYAAGTINTVAKLEAGVQAVAIDSKGNIFFSSGYVEGVGGFDSIHMTIGQSGSALANGTQEETVMFRGTGVILALAIDAEDNLVFSMGDDVSKTGGVFILRSSAGDVSKNAEYSSETITSWPDPGESTAGRRGPLGHDAVVLGADLGAFLPGVAVCPMTGDIFVARGHAGLTRMLKSDGFKTKRHWSTQEIKFTVAGKLRTPVMIWDVAVDHEGKVYTTTYMQGVVLMGVFPHRGSEAAVHLVAGHWDSGVSGSSGDGGRAKAARLTLPKGIAVGVDNTVYIGEFLGEKIRCLSTRGIISTCAGTGEKGYDGDGGQAIAATFNMPNDIAFPPGSDAGPMAVADFANNAIRLITPVCN